jgi:hypothetical protein
MSVIRVAVLGFVLAAIAGAGCNRKGDGGAATAVASCNTYCAALLAKHCPLPVYDSVDECKAAECANLGAAPAKCQGPLDTYYACEASQADLCADDGCLPQLGGILGCSPGAGPGTGGTQGSGGGAGVGGSGGEDAGSGAGGSSGMSTPAALGARLVLWLDAARGLTITSGGPIVRWQDQSGAKNDAVQPSPGNRPILTGAGIHGLPSATFDGSVTFLQIADAPTLGWGTQDFTLLVVARGAGNTSANTMLYQKSNLGPPYAGPALYLNANKPMPSTKVAMQLDGDFYTDSRDDFADDRPHLFGGRLVASGASAILEVRVDGARQGMLSVNPAIDADAPGQAVIIGHNGYNPSPGFQAFKGDIAEIVAVKGTVTDAELQSLEAYLMSKYALP